MYEYHEALKAEIAFWQELLSDSHLSSDSPVYRNRSNQAVIPPEKLIH